MTTEEIEVKVNELKETYKVEVHPVVFDTEEFGQVVGFLKEPERLSKLRAIDLLMMGQFTSASAYLLETSLIAEASDPRILMERPEYDVIYLGFIMKAQELIKYYSSVIKKN